LRSVPRRQGHPDLDYQRALDAGESDSDIAEDFQIDLSDVKEALKFEKVVPGVGGGNRWSLTFYFDRNFGSRFPEAIRAARPTTFSVEYHHDRKNQFQFGQTTPDDEWISKVAALGWIIFSHDRNFIPSCLRPRRSNSDLPVANCAGQFANRQMHYLTAAASAGGYEIPIVTENYPTQRGHLADHSSSGVVWPNWNWFLRSW